MTMKNTLVTVYICPHPDCSNYYASSSMPRPLEQQENRRTSMRNDHSEDPANWGGVTGTRDECPNCRESGRGAVKRLPVTVTLAVQAPA